MLKPVRANVTNALPELVHNLQDNSRGYKARYLDQPSRTPCRFICALSRRTIDAEERVDLVPGNNSRKISTKNNQILSKTLSKGVILNIQLEKV